MVDRELFSNTSTVPMCPGGLDAVVGKEFTIVYWKTYSEALVVYQCQMAGGRRETVVQFSRENERFLKRSSLPVRARMSWDGWRYKLAPARGD